MSRHFAHARFGSDRTSLYDEITNKIIAELEAGRVPWVQPWGTAAAKAALALPKNAATGRAYSGVNVLILWGAVIEHGFRNQSWLTFRQALSLGPWRRSEGRDFDRSICQDQFPRLVERAGFEPEVSLAVLPTAQSETPVPPRSATVILAQETGARSPCAAPDAELFRIAERPASIRSPPLVANAEFSPQPREVVGAHRILGTLLR